jgi:hypothetical protein
MPGQGGGMRAIESQNGHKGLAEAKTPLQKERIQRVIATTDRQIDRLVYELYGLTEEEIRVVEGIKPLRPRDSPGQ